jgi:tripartite-type tricarboxylate transporter receptor subunit TctC
MWLCGWALPAEADDASSNFPARPIELVVPFAAGGTTDVIARIAAQLVATQWGQGIVVLNKAGATGAIASEYVAHAKADGYTLLVATASTHAILPAYRTNLPYDTVDSFAPATLLTTFPTVLVVNSKVPAKNVAELIELLKNNPNKFNFGSSGTGGSTHFAGELFKLMTKTSMIHVPYKGSAPAMNDLLAGSVQITFDFLTTVMPQVEQGNLRALGVASLERSPLAPTLPAIAETVPGFDVTSWAGIVAPAGTPQAIVDKISKAFGDAIRRPEITKQLGDLGAVAATDTPQEFQQFIRDDRAKWQKIAKEADIKE